MKLRIPLAVSAAVIAGTLASCSAGAPTPPKAVAVPSSAPTAAPVQTVTPTPTETAVPTGSPAPATTDGAVPGAPAVNPSTGVMEVTLPPQAAGQTEGPEYMMAWIRAGKPIPDSELAGSRTAKQIRYEAGRLKAYLAANGVPADFATNGLDYISTSISAVNGPDELAAWDKDIQVGFMGSPDGSFILSGNSQVDGADPKYPDANHTLDYDSVKGFLRH